MKKWRAEMLCQPIWHRCEPCQLLLGVRVEKQGVCGRGALVLDEGIHQERRRA